MKKTFIETQQNDESSPKARGMRLRELRNVTQLSRKELEEKLHVSAQQIQSGEDGAKDGLTEKDAESIVKVLRGKGVKCDLDWLLSGTGNAPKPNEQPARRSPGN